MIFNGVITNKVFVFINMNSLYYVIFVQIIIISTADFSMEWSLHNLNTRKVYHLPKQRTRSNAVRNTLQRVYTSYNSQQKRFKNYLRNTPNYPIHNYHVPNLHHNTFPQYIYHVHYVNHAEPSHDSSEYTTNKNTRNTINIPIVRQPENMNTQFNFQQLLDLIHTSSNTKIQNFNPTSQKIHNNNNQEKRLVNINTNLNTDSISNRIIPSSQTFSTPQILAPKGNRSINIELSLKGQENINNQYNNDLPQNFDDDDNSNIPEIFVRMSLDQEDNNNVNQMNPEVNPSDKISSKKMVNNKIFLQSNINKTAALEIPEEYNNTFTSLLNMPIQQLENNNYQQINQSSKNIKNILTDIFITTPTKEKEKVVKDHLINTDFNLLNHTPKLSITENIKHHKEVPVKNNQISNISINISMPQEKINNDPLSTDANFNHLNHTLEITNNPIPNISVKLPMSEIENDDDQLIRDTKQSIQISNGLPETNSSISNLSVEEVAKVQPGTLVDDLIDSIYKKLLLSSEEISEEKAQITDTNAKITYENILNNLNKKLKELSSALSLNQSIIESNSKLNRKKLPENYNISVEISIPHQENISEQMNPEINVNRTNGKLQQLSIQKHSNSNLFDNLPKPTKENVNDEIILELKNTTTKTPTPQYDNNINDTVIFTSNLHQSRHKQQPEIQVSNSSQSADFNEQIIPNLNTNQFNKENFQVMTNPIYDVLLKVSLPHQKNISEQMNPEINVNQTNEKLQELSGKEHSNSNLSDNLPKRPKPTQENVNDEIIFEFKNITTKIPISQYDNNINDTLILTSNLHQSSHKQQPEIQVSNSPQSADFSEQIIPNLNINQFNKKNVQAMTNPIYDVSVKLSVPHQENLNEHMNPEFNDNQTNKKLQVVSLKKYSNFNLSDNLKKPTQENVNDGVILKSRNTTTKTPTPPYDNNINDTVILTSNLHQSNHTQPDIPISDAPQSADFYEQIIPNSNTNQFNKDNFQVMTNPIYDVSVKVSLPRQDNITEHMNPEFNVNQTNEKLQKENVNDDITLKIDPLNQTSYEMDIKNKPITNIAVKTPILQHGNSNDPSHKVEPGIQISIASQTRDFNGQITRNSHTNQLNNDIISTVTSLKNDGKNIIRTIKLTTTTRKPINTLPLNRKIRQHILSDNKLNRKNIIRTTKCTSTTSKPINTVTLPLNRKIRQKFLSDNKLYRSHV